MLGKGVALEKKVLGGGDYVDARVEPSAIKAHTGKQSLHMLTPKAEWIRKRQVLKLRLHTL